jgi:acyl-ACP thioesterase
MSTFEIRPDAPNIYTEKIKIRSYHVDMHRKLTLPKLCSFFQDIAGNHTVECGVGWEVLQNANMFWVLSRLKIEICTYPDWEDEITIRTWSNGLQGLMAIRHFQVLNSSGHEIIKAISSWVMVNIQNRRLVRADDYMRDFPLNNEWLFESSPGKIEAIQNPLSYTPTKVSFTETDMNRHMNNVSYIDRIMNSYGYDFLLSHKISNFEINFQKEAVPGDSLLVKQQMLQKLIFLNSIEREGDNNELVRTKIQWESI